MAIDISELNDCRMQEIEFKSLASQWKRETRFMSNIPSKSMNIAYQGANRRHVHHERFRGEQPQ